MIIPYGTSTKLDCHRSTDIRAIEYSPTGHLVALLSTQAIQIWSQGATPILLASIPQKRPAASNKSLLRKEFLFWSPDGTMICVIRGEGVAEFYQVTHSIYELNTSYEEDNNKLELPYCTVESLQRISIEGKGLPTSACRGDNCIFIGTDNGYIHQLLWHGVLNTVSLEDILSKTPSSSSLNIQSNNMILKSMDYHSIGHYMILTLSNGITLLLLPPSSMDLPLSFSDIIMVQKENSTICTIGQYRDILAIGNKDSTISVYSISISENNVWSVEHSFDLSLYMYNGIKDEGLLGVETLRWCEHNDALAVGYNRKGMIVWNMQNIPIHIYMDNIEEEIDMNSNQKPGVHALCWSKYSDMLIYTCPSEQVWKENGVTSLSWDGQIYIQPFIVYNNSYICSPSRGLWCRSSSQMLYIYQDTIDIKKTYKHIYDIPPSFLKKNYPFKFICSNTYGDKVCIASHSGIAIMDQKTMQWFVYNELMDVDSYLTCLCWYKSDILLLCVKKPHGSFIYAYRYTGVVVDKCMQEINIDTDETLIDIQVQDKNIYILTNSKAILTFTITVVDDTKYTDVLPIISGNKFLLPAHCRHSYQLLPVPTSSTSLYLDPMNIYNINRPMNSNEQLSNSSSSELDPDSTKNKHNDNIDESSNESNTIIEDDIYSYKQTQICLIYSEDGALDMINFTEGIHRHMYRDIQQVFISISPSDLPLKLRVAVYVRGRTNSYFWYPLIDSSFDKTSNVPVFSPMGYIYKNTPIYILPHIGCCISNVNFIPTYMKKDALQLETHSIIHLLLWYLLNLNIFSISRYMLLYFYNHKIPHLSSSLEYLLHISLNSSKQTFLRHLLNLLSSIPIFPRILTTCLRKQERSTWPYVIRNREQSLKMFTLFLKSRDMEFASTSLALVQGLLCTVSETYIDKLKEDEEKVKLLEEKKKEQEKEQELTLPKDKTISESVSVSESKPITEDSTTKEPVLAQTTEYTKDTLDDLYDNNVIHIENIASKDSEEDTNSVLSEKEEISLHSSIDIQGDMNPDLNKMNTTLNTITVENVFNYQNLHTTEEKHSIPITTSCGLCAIEHILNDNSTTRESMDRISSLSEALHEVAESTEKKNFSMEIDCTAHLCGLRLFMVAIEEDNYDIGTEAYRFIVMEEQRHEDVNMCIPNSLCLNTVLSRYCYYLLTQCQISKLLKIVKFFPFQWTPYYNSSSKFDSGDIDIDNYYIMLKKIKQELKWDDEEQLQGPPIQIVKDDVDSVPLIIEDNNNVHQNKDAATTEAVEHLLYLLMKANAAQWSLMLMTLLMKTQKAALIAEARPDIWTQVKKDILANHDELIKSFIRKVDLQVNILRQEKEELLK